MQRPNRTTLIVNSLFNGIPSNAVTYEMEILDSAGNPTGTNAVSGNQVQVTLTYSNFPMPILYQLLGLITGSDQQGSDTPTIKGSASMRYLITTDSQLALARLLSRV